MSVHPSITFLVNVSPTKILDIPTSFFAAAFMQMHLLQDRWALQLKILQVHRSHDVEGTGQHLVKGKKAGISDGVPWTAV